MVLLAAPIYAPFVSRERLAFGFLFVLQGILQIMALIFLYSKSSSNWYNSFKTNAHLPV